MTSKAEPTNSPWPNPVYAWFVVFVLMLAYTNSFIDRQILSLLVEPIRADLAISDTQVSLLAGLAFSIFYTVMGLPLAWLADRSHRRNIIAVGIAAWSLMTALCGAAKNFWHLFFARIGVGIGEATLSPAAMSIISDYFPKDRLARAVAVYSMGVYLGAGLALMIGGAVIGMVVSAGAVELPVLGSVQPWQMTFFYVGLLGLPILLLIMMVREPLRRGGDGVAMQEAGAGFADLRVFISDHAATVWRIIIAFTLSGIVIVGYLAWIPTMFIRTFGWSAPDIGLTYGALTFVLGTGGVYAGGYVADWFAARGHDDAIMRTSFYGGLAVLPFAILTPLAPTDTLAVVGLAVTTFLFGFQQSLPIAAFQMIAPNRLRAQMTAFYFLIAALIAQGFGPTIVALGTDYVFGDPAQLRYSLAATCALVMPLGLVSAWMSLKPYASSVRGTLEG